MPSWANRITRHFWATRCGVVPERTNDSSCFLAASSTERAVAVGNMTRLNHDQFILSIVMWDGTLVSLKKPAAEVHGRSDGLPDRVGVKQKTIRARTCEAVLVKPLGDKTLNRSWGEGATRKDGNADARLDGIRIGGQRRGKEAGALRRIYADPPRAPGEVGNDTPGTTVGDGRRRV